MGVKGKDQKIKKKKGGGGGKTEPDCLVKPINEVLGCPKFNTVWLSRSSLARECLHLFLLLVAALEKD